MENGEWRIQNPRFSILHSPFSIRLSKSETWQITMSSSWVTLSYSRA